ncbi:CDP-alcohol phosphatidyltransferase family protein [Desulfosporosinus meridiei]|uniref:Phosphatidylglycerophosphate synthase n=1 Tax=Desulfosporosinus meridiei (strain ATCC BAA-275 / DSM 13257 / KCTC 12902 / NCIMB 13706 / S10) TaxID=768704 RepID=J7IP88_DESMD|nr:CDP-alcohol phosphatidyltransferase family protein [Desulfosporosinus meridiei]AFQ43415.1 phosphatidylglycerophosphate synthase [Desulfosporosinus meridiei DSM 13257]
MLDTHARRYIQPIIDLTADFLDRLKITANQVTIAAFVMGIASGFAILLEQPILAVSLLWFSGFLDAVDGSIARKHNAASPWGTLMDITFDRLVELSVILGLAWCYPGVRFLLLLLTAGIIFSMTVFLTVGALVEKTGIKSFYYQAGLAERTEGFIFLSLMTLFPGRINIFTSLFILAVTFTALQRLREAKRIL